MRQNPTKCEAILFDALVQEGIEFKSQVQIGPYIADCVLRGKHVIEVDGPLHDKQRGYDLARDRYMWGQHYRVLRVTNAEVVRDVGTVVERIRAFMAEVGQ
jgi:very-short-patch-repair endonuclease